MNALLLVAHGSRRQESNDEIRELAGKVANHASNNADLTDCAFLELAEPSIPDGIQACIDRGASKVVVYPYFLSQGRHVIEDIPALVAPKVAANPSVNIVIADYLGASEAVIDTVVSTAARALT